jgi:hypothetical protein
MDEIETVRVVWTANSRLITDTTRCAGCRRVIRDPSDPSTPYDGEPIIEATIDSDGVVQVTGRAWCGASCR